ncbi:hypothetical protein Acy02nite_51700 [Actinoplanes cyaneus]|uniref:Uncharacterized protein n=1 Tax=Actinoplanes cyaneus TaxID=52696 RepID=A0A919IK35_9ACTN|nr:hypothetical protein [Actinoplanes cyaneus]MCW2141221.1 hypothetical protein [Actinoplanes cyaneus]GID67289.1 hypothetical protein Acy02nite_51700 [Actinoplanes cyaneus]
MFNENIDLYVMAVAALVFTILGATGLTSTTTLISMTLAVLTGLAVSQIKTRRYVAQVAASPRANPSALLRTDFPDDLTRRREAASDLLYVGIAMGRTTQTSAEAFHHILTRGGRIRVLLIDPTDDAVVAEAFRRRRRPADPERLRSTVLASLTSLAELDVGAAGSIEVRVSRYVPAVGISATDTGAKDGLVVAQLYEYRAQGEPAPIFQLAATDGYWYRHFLDEAERMWADGVPWPLPVDERAGRSPRPVFAQSFGEPVTEAMARSRHTLITGAARNTLLTSQYGLFERRLSEGAELRFLLLDPASAAVAVAAERYYVHRAPDALRMRIEHSLRLLAELSRAAGGRLRVRLTAYPLAAGLIATGSQPDVTGTELLFVEYFTYQAPGEPKFVLTRDDGWAFDNFLGEAEALWAGALEVDLGRVS